MRFHESLIERIDGMYPDILAALKGLIAYPSYEENGEAVSGALRYCLTLASELGLEARLAAGGSVGVISCGPVDAEKCAVLAHVDVVPEGDWSLWKFPPYEMTVADGSVYGRGVGDDKGPLISCLFAIKAVLDEAAAQGGLKKRLELILGTREETVWTDMEAYVNTEKLPDYGFTPDGDFPIGNVEKGYMDIVVTFPFTENDNEIVVLTAGNARNIIPEYAELRIDSRDILLTAHGRSVHSSVPERGVNAISALSRETRIHEVGLNPAARNCLSFIREHLSSDVFGKSFGIYREEDTYQGEYVHHTVCAPTLLATSETGYAINLNLRTSPPDDPNEILSRIAAVASLYGASVEADGIQSTVFVPRTRPFLRKMAQAYSSVTGKTADFTLGYGASYAKAMPNIVSFGPVFPGSEDSIHEANERVEECDLKSAGRIYALALGLIAYSDEKLI